MLKRLLIGLMIALTACSTMQQDEQVIESAANSEEFGSYVRLFELEAKSRGLELRLGGLRMYMVKFSDSLKSQGVIGLCTYESDKQIIYVSQEDWDSYDSLQREMLVFHEMGHCILGQPHDNSTNQSGTPEDLMYPSNFPSSYYAFNRAQYLDRMFGKVIANLTKQAENEKLGLEPELDIPKKNKYFCKWKHQVKITETKKKPKSTKPWPPR